MKTRPTRILLAAAVACVLALATTIARAASSEPVEPVDTLILNKVDA